MKNIGIEIMTTFHGFIRPENSIRIHKTIDFVPNIFVKIRLVLRKVRYRINCFCIQTQKIIIEDPFGV